jgi:hypothetical protein
MVVSTSRKGFAADRRWPGGGGSCILPDNCATQQMLAAIGFALLTAVNRDRRAAVPADQTARSHGADNRVAQLMMPTIE